jgi:outer membrane protein TolC
MQKLCLLPLVLVLLHPPASSAAEPTNAAPARSITLQECFDLALKYNLDLQIERINPGLKLMDLDIARASKDPNSGAGYDPAFTASSVHGNTLGGGGIDPKTLLPTPGSKLESDTFSSGISGLTPLGLSYNLSGNATETYGTLGGGPYDQTRGSVVLTLMQPLLKNFLTDTVRYNILVAKNRIRYYDLHLRQQIMSILTSVEQAYYELIFDFENVKVQEKGLQLAERLLAENKKRVEIGTLARLDEKQAESQVAARQTDLITALGTLTLQQNVLKTLITARYRVLHDTGLEPSEPLLALPTTLDLQESWGKGLSQRPDLLESRLDLEKAGIDVKYYKNQRLPELDLTGSYGHGASGGTTREFSDAFNDFRTGDKPFYTVGASVTVPLDNLVARSRYRQGKLLADQALLTLKKLEETILSQIDNDVSLVRTTFNSVDSSRKARIYAEEALEAEQKKLENGASTSFVVLSLQRDLTTARLAEIRALADYNKALAALALDEGTVLERHKMNLEVK